MLKEIFLIPNFLSLIRILTVIPVGYLLFYKLDEAKPLIIGLFLFMYITDLLDGYLARKLNQITETGKIIDPIADKIAVGTIAILLFFRGLIPLWFIIIVLLRDMLILIFGLYLKRRYKVTLMSNYPGKLAVFSIGLILLLSVINSELLNNQFSFTYYIVICLIFYSSILYFKRFIKITGENRNGE
jgi:CDP-diacylglycerol--glycerol-3-phosphate 3-phosphatidyltransferase